MQLRIADDIVETVGTLHQLSRVIARQDPDLSKQLRRAASSIGLNAGEGLAARGGNRTVRLESAMASGREVIMALRIAGAAGYVDKPRVAREVDAVDRIDAPLYKLAYRASLPGELNERAERADHVEAVGPPRRRPRVAFVRPTALLPEFKLPSPPSRGLGRHEQHGGRRQLGVGPQDPR